METLPFLLKMVFISGAWDPLIDQHDPLIPSEEDLETWSSTMITYMIPDWYISMIPSVGSHC